MVELHRPTNLYTDVIDQLLLKCVSTRNLRLAMLLHSHIIKTGLTSHTFLAYRLLLAYAKCNAPDGARRAFDDIPFSVTHSWGWNKLLSAYAQAGLLDHACHLFDEMPNKNTLSYNLLISGFHKHGHHQKSISAFNRMVKDFGNALFIDNYTLVSVIGACASMGASNFLHQLHGMAILVGLDLNTIVHNAFIHAYGKCGRSSIAYQIFARMPEKDIVSWTATLVAHCRASRLEDALHLFSEMPVKNAVSWTALISGFVHNGCGMEALDLFQQMKENGARPTAHTFVTILSACADLAFMVRGKQIHGHIIRVSDGSTQFNAFVSNALVDMYCKCGDMKSAQLVFERMHQKDVVSWNSMITGFAQNGHWEESLDMFRKMTKTITAPNNVTFIGVLSACSHRGLISEALRMLEMMENVYGISPSCDHYAIIIDLFGRKDRLEEAIHLVERNSEVVNHVGVWGALLGACRVHGNLELARKAGEILFALEPLNAARYVMLSNVYSASRRWDDANKLRGFMEESGLKKEAAHSCIEVGNAWHEFVAKDNNHSQMEEICEMVGKLVEHMKDAGYAHHSNTAFLPDDDDASLKPQR